MTKYVQAGASYPYRVNYTVNGELVIPSAATITVQKQDGTYADGINGVTLSHTTTSTTYNISSAANVKTLPYELRYVLVKYTYAGIEYTQRDVYTLKDSILLPVTPEDVRIMVAMTSEELPDENIDLFLAYSEFSEAVGEAANIDTLLAGGSALTPTIMRGITAQAALNSCIMLEFMIYQSEQADNTIYNRFSKVDFEMMLARLRGIVADSIVGVNGATITDVTIFTVFTGTDPVTGA